MTRSFTVHIASSLMLAFVVAACATPAVNAAPATIGTAGVISDAARATAVVDSAGVPVGKAAYPGGLLDAVKAGDTAAYLLLLQDLPQAERDNNLYADAFLAIDRAAAGDLPAARELIGIDPNEPFSPEQSGFHLWLNSWFLALEGRQDEALDSHRQVAEGMPGLTGDLSLAAMLEAIGRPEQALAVYEAMTPSVIRAPEHSFDPQGLVYTHVKTVIARHALLLQRLGRVDEAKVVYARLAAAEPEEAASYAAALESLETGKNLDNKPLDLRSGFAQALGDVSRAMQEQRIIAAILSGDRSKGFDSERTAFDLVALLIHPDDEGLRSSVIDALYEQALYEGVAHVALTAPEPTSSLQISAAQALIMTGDTDAARKAITAALDLKTEENTLQTLYGALRLRSLLDDEQEAYALVPEVLALATNDAERAAAAGLVGTIYAHFGDTTAAAKYAGEARLLDDTNDRRMSLADALGKDGRVDEAIVILRAERLVRPNDPYSMNSLGYFLITRTDKLDEGYKLLARAIALAENDPYIADSYGWALYKLGHLDQARAHIEGARDELLPHRHWELEDHLGDIYWHLGRKDDARASWQHALDARPPRTERTLITAKLAEGLTTPAPEKRPLPEVSLSDEDVARRDI